MEDIKNVLLVVNPISGAIDKTTLVEQVKMEVIKMNASLIIYQTSGNEDVFHLTQAIKENNPCRILVAGGDGTIKLSAEALQDLTIPLGIIPVGSANGLATNLQLPTSLEEQIKIGLGNTFTKMDTIVINNEYCLHMSDFGLNAELIREYENSTVRGKLGYLLQSIPTLVKSDYPFKFEIKTNNKIFKKEGILLAIANAQSYGTGATVNPKGKINDGKFEILIFKNFDVVEILKTLRNEVDPNPDFLEIISTKKARITCFHPVAFQIDGEFKGNLKEIEAQINPKSIEIAVPAYFTT